MAVQRMLATMDGMLYLPLTKVPLRKDCALSTNVPEVVLFFLEVLEGVLCVPELLEGMQRIPEAVENSARCRYCG